jgi:hypothetical protein
MARPESVISIQRRNTSFGTLSAVWFSGSMKRNTTLAWHEGAVSRSMATWIDSADREVDGAVTMVGRALQFTRKNMRGTP